MSCLDLPYWLAALYLPHMGPRTVMRYYQHFSDIKTVFQASREDLQAAGMHTLHIDAFLQPNWQAVEKDLIWAKQANQHIVTFTDQDYPALLKEISDPPILLFVRGDKTVLARKQIAIVGSRYATRAGINHAHALAHTLATTGLAITSGLALGIDGASHRGALAANGVTIGVAGTGLNYVYPASHRDLIEEIVKYNGAVVSEFPLFMRPHANHFPRRNRIISGLSLGVVVVEAALQSGSLITARHALEQGREVFAVPGSIQHTLAHGCHHLIRQGAKLVETAADILEEIPAYHFTTMPPVAKTQLKPKEKPLLSTASNQVLAHLSYEITPLDVISLQSGLTTTELSSILLTLELDGYIQSVPGGYRRNTIFS